MARHLAVLVALALSAREAGAGTLASLEAEQEELFDRVAPAVVVISGGGALGAGFAVGPGQVLTAAHVVGTRREVTVTLRDGRAVAGTVEEVAPGDLDVALVRIPAALPVLELSGAARLRAGSVVASVGHPDGHRWTLATGLVAQDTADAADEDLVRLQLPLRPGASGGPLVDRAGRVVGIVTHGGPGAAFAVRIGAAVGKLGGLAAARRPAPPAATYAAPFRPTP